MRTTLDLDDRVLAAARARARAEGITLGRAVSDLAFEGLGGHEPAPEVRNGILLLPSTPGHVITDEMVADALAED